MTLDTVNHKYPTRDECLEILIQSGCSENVINHIQAVSELVIKVAQRIPGVNMALLVAGAMLHDLGRAKTHSIHHAVVGAEMATELGMPEDVVLIIERHIGAGVTNVDAAKYGLPQKNYMPETIEQKVVASSDNLFEGDKRCSIDRSVQIFIERGLPDVAERVRELHDEVSAMAGIGIDNIK